MISTTNFMSHGIPVSDGLLMLSKTASTSLATVLYVSGPWLMRLLLLAVVYKIKM